MNYINLEVNMNVDERNIYIDRCIKYVRLVADHVESIVIRTHDGDTIEFKSNKNGDDLNED